MPSTDAIEGIPGKDGTNGTNGTNGAPGTPGATGAPGTPFTPNTPSVVTPAFGVAAQAADPTKPALISIMTRATYNITVAATFTDTIELRIGAVASEVAAGTGASIKVAEAIFGITGIALAIGMGLDQENQLVATLPIGWYYAVRRTNGTRAVIATCVSQPLS